jgi:hypothetical protein
MALSFVHLSLLLQYLLRHDGTWSIYHSLWRWADLGPKQRMFDMVQCERKRECERARKKVTELDKMLRDCDLRYDTKICVIDQGA